MNHHSSTTMDKQSCESLIYTYTLHVVQHTCSSSHRTYNVQSDLRLSLHLGTCLLYTYISLNGPALFVASPSFHTQHCQCAHQLVHSVTVQYIVKSKLQLLTDLFVLLCLLIFIAMFVVLVQLELWILSEALLSLMSLCCSVALMVSMTTQWTLSRSLLGDWENVLFMFYHGLSQHSS